MTIQCVLQQIQFSGFGWLKSSERHRHDKHRRGSFGYAPLSAVPRDRLFDFPYSFCAESQEEHLSKSIAGFLRLRAVNPSLCDGSARRSAQRFCRSLDEKHHRPASVYGFQPSLRGYSSLTTQPRTDVLGYVQVVPSGLDAGGCVRLPTEECMLDYCSLDRDLSVLAQDWEGRHDEPREHRSA